MTPSNKESGEYEEGTREGSFAADPLVQFSAPQQLHDLLEGARGSREWSGGWGQILMAVAGRTMCILSFSSKISCMRTTWSCSTDLEMLNWQCTNDPLSKVEEEIGER